MNKDTYDKKDQNSLDLENMTKVIKRIANDMVDLKKLSSDNSHRFANKTSFIRYNTPTSKRSIPLEEKILDIVINIGSSQGRIGRI